MENWIQSILGLDKLTETNLLNLEAQKSLAEQNQKLMVYKSNGTVSSIVQGADGKVVNHAGFTQAGGSAFNPLLAIQFASILSS